jgi:Holliday junction resolvase-like predicted endonuclease
VAQHNENGKEAEEKASFYLQQQGFTVLDRNWRVSFAEIDIVAQKDDCIYFVEVKYKNKLHKLELGANAWVQAKNWQGEYQLLIAEVTGNEFTVDIVNVD